VEGGRDKDDVEVEEATKSRRGHRPDPEMQKSPVMKRHYWEPILAYITHHHSRQMR